MSDSFNKLAEEEAKLFSSLIVSPVVKGQPISVRIAGVVMRFQVKPRDFKGWGVFRPRSYKHVQFCRSPNMAEKQAYLRLFPAMRVILCRKSGEDWYGITGDSGRISVLGLIPVRSPESVQIFDTVKTRFDGATFWFEAVQGEARKAAYMREQLANCLEPEKLVFSGLTPSDVTAYQVSYIDFLEQNKDKEEERLKRALEIGGATYKSYIERGNTYTVEYTVGNESFKSVVNKETLAVESAGICLSGGDHLFDLASLVSVVKEGQQQRHIVRVGDINGGLTQERYEDIYGRGANPRRPADEDDW